MPQNTPMKRQYTTIDGRTVMSNLPQHWGGNDWTITGVDNPLPVGNYVQTKSGVWIPQKGSDDGAADVRLTGSNMVEPLPTIRPTKTIQETLLNAKSLAEKSDSGWIDLNVTNESYLWILVQIDVSPWTLYTTQPWSSLRTTRNVYPEKRQATSVHAATNKSSSLLLNVGFESMKDDYPSTLVEALSMAGIWTTKSAHRPQVNITNHANSIATVTLEVLRVWR